MNDRLIRTYVRLVMAEAEDHLARVPQQLVSPDKGKGSENKEEEEESKDNVNEFSSLGAGSIMGYTGPLGIDPDKLGRQMNAPRRRKKKKSSKR